MKKQRGFSILTLLIAAVALFGILSAIVSLSRSGATASADSIKPAASAIITQGNNLATAFMSATGRGVADSSITFDNAASTGLYNPSVSGLTIQTPPTNAFNTGATGIWYYPTTGAAAAYVPVLKIKGVGTDAAADYVFVVGDLTQKACQEINKQLGDTNADPSATIVATFAWANVSTVPAAADLTGVAASNQKMQYCVKDSNGKYFYYVVVEAL